MESKVLTVKDKGRRYLPVPDIAGNGSVPSLSSVSRRLETREAGSDQIISRHRSLPSYQDNGMSAVSDGPDFGD